MRLKILLIILLLLTSFVSGYVIIDNGYMLTKNEMSNLSDETIANYMSNSLLIDSFELKDNKIIIYYNLTYFKKIPKEILEIYYEDSAGVTQKLNELQNSVKKIKTSS